MPVRPLLPLAVLLVAAAAHAADPIDAALARAETSIDAIAGRPAAQRTFANTVEAVDDIVAQIELDTNMIQFLAYVSTSAEERAAGRVAEERVANFLVDLATNERLYSAVRAYADTKPALKPIEQRLLDHVLRDFRRAGMALPAAQRTAYVDLQKEINRLGVEFQRNIDEDETVVPLAPEELAGMPADWLAAQRRAGDMIMLGMSYPEFLPVQDLCTNEATREKTWLAYKRRGGMRNVHVLEELLKRRAEAARMLGYACAADFETEVRMAHDAATVASFYAKLRPLVREKAQRDWAEFEAAKRAETGDPHAVLRPWDTSFIKNRLLETKYAVDPQKVQEYFPLQACIDGLFGITQSLYGIEYREITDESRAKGELWHEDVRKFAVHDRSDGRLLGHFMIDLHPREAKYGHAAQWGIRQHKVWSDGHVTLPLAILVCNFTKPTPEKPSLLTHDEVETFFHEFGHCLHTILSEGRFWRFAGTGVETDFVEAPSQMFENWVWDADVLRTFARHYRTGDPFPSDLLEGMTAARHLGSGLDAERQFYYGMYDMAVHSDPEGDVDTVRLAADLWGAQGEGVELYAAVPETWFQAAFGHLKHYQAGYYGYQWSLVYACDMFRRFRELGMLDPAAGMAYRKAILARGGEVDGLELIRGFLGREPDPSAYLDHLGLNDER